MSRKISSGDQVDPQKEWWWVVEHSDYIRKQYPGTPRYTVIPASQLGQYRNILCKVRYSSEAAATAAAIAAATDGGDEKLCAWEVVTWPPTFLNAHPETSRFEAVPQNDIQKFWSLGAKSVQAGLSHPDALHEAARRCTAPERWCVLLNDNENTKRKEPYTVKLAEFVSFSEEDRLRATCESEHDAWEAIPRIKAEDDEQLARHKQQQKEWEKTQRRSDRVRGMLEVVFAVALVSGLAWLIITAVHWFWKHPLF